MKVGELSLTHKCYRVSVDDIDEATVEGIIRSESEGKAVVCFKNDKNRYIVPLNAKNIFALYFFSYDDAYARQKKLRINAVWNAAVKKERATLDYAKIMEKYGEYHK